MYTEVRGSIEEEFIQPPKVLNVISFITSILLSVEVYAQM